MDWEVILSCDDIGVWGNAEEIDGEDMFLLGNETDGEDMPVLDDVDENESGSN